jgi:Lectin C-type domain
LVVLESPGEIKVILINNMQTNTLVQILKSLTAAIATCALVPLSAFGGPSVLHSAINPANGHVYYLLSSSDWPSAENAAIGLGGHLATIRSLAENNWVVSTWGTNGPLWIGLHDPVLGDGGGAQHAADFVWSSGETSSYRDWYPGEPNGPDDYAVIGDYANGYWNDASAPAYGVVEISICTPHHATATAIVYSNFVVGATITDSGCGYTNAPQVSIIGGGGSGATATATFANGVVTAINITSAGYGYTNAPLIIIASPPFVPTLSINTSAVKVTQHLMLGVNYQLQSSPDLVNWTPVGSVFTATNETIVSEFEINVTNRYFRILQMP